jgi:hypothetical protein
MKYGTAGSAIVKYLSLCVLRDPFVICLLPCETCAAQIKGRKKSSLPPPRFHLMVRGTLAGWHVAQNPAPGSRNFIYLFTYIFN